MGVRRGSFRIRTLMFVVLAVALTLAWIRHDRRSIRLRPGDRIYLQVSEAFPTKYLSREWRVFDDGTLYLGSFGSVHVVGMTVPEARVAVTAYLSQWRSGTDADEITVTLVGERAEVSSLIDLEPFWLSLRVATIATMLIVAIGLPVALLLARCRFRGRELLAGVLLLPLVLPPTVLGFLLLQVIGRRTILGAWLESALGVTIVFSPTGAVIASALAAFPLFLIPARASFEAVEPALEDVARILGRREWSVFFHVTLPLSWRGIASGAVLAFARALGDFGATLMVAGDFPGRTRTASLAIYNAVQTDDFSTAAWMTFLISLVSVIALVAAQRAIPPVRGVRR